MGDNEFYDIDELDLDQLGLKYNKREYAKYLFESKIPKRFAGIILPEILISLALFALVKLDLITTIYRPLHVVALGGFWVLTWWLARRNDLNTTELRHYYMCNVMAYLLFLLVAAAAFVYNYCSDAFPRDAIYYPAFRMSYVFGLLDNKRIEVEELFMSLSAFYSVTFAIIMLEPVVPIVLYNLVGMRDFMAEKRFHRNEARFENMFVPKETEDTGNK